MKKGLKIVFILCLVLGLSLIHIWFDIAGYGRQSFAYPDFANDILDKGGFQAVSYTHLQGAAGGALGRLRLHRAGHPVYAGLSGLPHG